MPAFVARVVENRSLAGAAFLLRLDGCEALAASEPGQFAMLRGEWGWDPVTPRAMSVLRVRDGVADFVIKQVGRGTALLRRARAGDRVHVLGPMGVGFPAPAAGRRDALIAGGVGMPPLYMQAARAAAAGLGGNVTLYYGARSAADLVLLDEIVEMGVRVVAATEDGSMGVRGRVTDALDLDAADAVMACGPNAMLRGVRDAARARGIACWLSIEESMACAVRACLGCAVAAAGERARQRKYLYVCTDGPVFSGEDIWP